MEEPDLWQCVHAAALVALVAGAAGCSLFVVASAGCLGIDGGGELACNPAGVPLGIYFLPAALLGALHCFDADGVAVGSAGSGVDAAAKCQVLIRHCPSACTDSTVCAQHCPRSGWPSVFASFLLV